MPEFILNKLVRDNLPGLMESAGQTPVVHTLEGRALQLAMLEKIKEEVGEATAAIDGDNDSLGKELADMQEIIDALCKSRGIKKETLSALQKTIAAKKGTFENGYFIESLFVPDGSEWAQYYRDEPDRFIELVASLEVVDMPTIQIGTYEHYKGGQYDVIGLARHSETDELFVVYKPLYEHDTRTDMWIRPREMFIGEVVIEGVSVPRFRKV